MRMWLGILIIVLMCSAAFAIAPSGAPTAGQKQGEWRVGADYSYSEMDVEGTLSDSTEALWEDIFDVEITDDSATLEDVELSMGGANIGYGLNDNWEIFVRLGGSSIKNDDLDDIDIDLGADFLFGIGTKITLSKGESVDWGVMAQTNRISASEDFDDSDAEIEVEAWETQIAFGPTWHLSDSFSIYGGPFLHFLDGEIDAKSDGLSGSADIEQESEFGGYVGAQLDVKPNAGQLTNGLFLFGETHFTADAWAVATGIGWKF